MKLRKKLKRLMARVRDYEQMVGRVGWKAPNGAYHKPGSLNK